MNNKKLLLLHLSQAEKACQRTRVNQYSNTKREKYHHFLEQLISKISEKTDSVAYDETSFKDYKLQLDFVFKSLEFLDSSTHNLIPYELVHCLEHAMRDWLLEDEADKYVIVTSLVNDVNKFSFDPSISIKRDYIDSLNRTFDLSPPCFLVEMSLPKSLSRDYLSMVVLYHELGHFIDEKYQISKKTAYSIVGNIADGFYQYEIVQDEIQALNPYFGDNISDAISNVATQRVLERYCAEYFCDLFAAQYVGVGYMHYLDYATNGSIHASPSHPATSNRSKVYNDFLNKEDNPILRVFNDTLLEMGQGFELRQRFEKIEANAFYELIPLDIQNVSQLHGIFAYGWEVWMDDWSKFNKGQQSSYPFRSDKVHSIINNLIEKSIGNYIVTNKWKQARESSPRVQ